MLGRAGKRNLVRVVYANLGTVRDRKGLKRTDRDRNDWGSWIRG